MSFLRRHRRPFLVKGQDPIFVVAPSRPRAVGRFCAVPSLKGRFLFRFAPVALQPLRLHSCKRHSLASPVRPYAG